VAVAVAAIVLAVVGFELWQQWRSPAAFGESHEVYQDDGSVGEPLYVGISHDRRAADGSVTIHGAEADVARDEAAARVEYFVCTVDPTSGVGSIGAVDATMIARECTTLDPVTGGVLDLNADPRQQVVMGVTATRPGTTVVRGTALSYTHGWQRGTQYLDVGLRLTAAE
jgi:hypothetical protein